MRSNKRFEVNFRFQTTVVHDPMSTSVAFGHPADSLETEDGPGRMALMSQGYFITFHISVLNFK